MKVTRRLRLTREEERQAIGDFVDYRYPDGAPEGYAEGCRVLYRDDEAEARSWYHVVDAQGRADGSGEEYEVR